MPSNVAVVAHRRKLSPDTATDLRKALADAGWGGASWTEVPQARAASDAAAAARRDGAEVVIVCGGDGTVRAAAQALVDSDVALAVVPVGTANLFATAFDLPADPANVVQLAQGGGRRVVDTGTCNGRTFAVMAGVGFDAAMLDEADARKDRLGMLAYLRAIVHEARTRTPMRTGVVVDGAGLFDGRASCVLVGNVPTLKAGIRAFPDGSPTDGRLDVAVITAVGLRQWAGALLAAIRRRPAASRHVVFGAGSTIDVRLARRHRYELDGGVKGRERQLTFRSKPGSLRICAPTDA